MPLLEDVRDVSTRGHPHRSPASQGRGRSEGVGLSVQATLRFNELRSQYDVPRTDENPEVGRPIAWASKKILWFFLKFRLDVVSAVSSMN